MRLPGLRDRPAGWVTILILLVGTGLAAGSIGPAGPASAAPVTPDPTSATVPALPSVAVVPADATDPRWPLHAPWDACPRPVWPGRLSVGEPGAGRRVLVIGDSLTRESRTLTAAGMRASGWTPTFRCWGSRRLDWGLDQVARSRDLHQLPGYVMIALGTNDISWETQATTERRLRDLLHRLGPKRQILWVDLHLTRSAWLDARADWFNALLRRLRSEHRNLTVVPWHQVARGHGIRGWDGIHYTASGYRLRARTVVAALDAVGRRHPAAGSSEPPGPTPVPPFSSTPSAAPTPSAAAGPPTVPVSSLTSTASPTAS